jgi:hypothetical protein
MCLKNDREGLVRKLSARFHLLRILSPFTVSTTSRTETLNSNSKKIKMNSFARIPHPFPSLFNTSSCFFLYPFPFHHLAYQVPFAVGLFFSFFLCGSGVLSPIHGPAEVPSFEKILPLRWDSNPLAPGPRPRSTVSDSHAATELLVLFISLLYIVIIFHHFFPCILLLPFLVAFL